MKSIILFGCLGLLITTVNAQQKGTPDVVREAFSKTFPGIIPKWEKENKDFEANFKKDGQDMSAVFAANGELKETEMSIAVAALPVTVTDYVAKHYKGASIKAAAKITKADGTVSFEAEVNHTAILFDSGGKFLKEEKD